MQNLYSNHDMTDQNHDVKTKKWSNIVFFISGIGALIWFLIRVIPKPQRAAYPCQRAAFPIASSFVLYLISLAASVLFFKNFYKRLIGRKYILASLSLLIVIMALASSVLFNHHNTILAQGRKSTLLANQPIGIARGIFPGRVVWIHSPLATNPDCDASTTTNSPYWNIDNNDPDKLDTMVAQGIRKITGAGTNSVAWDSIFKFHNRSMGKGNVSYTAGEKIWIKINATSAWDGNYDPATIKRIQYFGNTVNDYYGIAETNPQLILSLLRQLVNTAGIAQTNIYLGDPMKHIYSDNFAVFKAEFPNIHYLDHSSSLNGREVVVPSTTAKIYYSDSTAIPQKMDFFYTVTENMEYLINVPTMKGHKYAGMTMFAKNHFGSNTEGSAAHLHGGLVRIDDNDTRRPDYGSYRVQVDLMGNKYIGKRNLFFLMDALYTSPMEISTPVKWQMAPFKNDWTSSIFVSFDNVAIESVGYDFLKTEFTNEADFNGNGAWPQMSGVDDYLQQAADSSKWPKGLKYDPDHSGTPIGSLGVNERWNNSIEKKYSRNLSPSGKGIELVYVNIDTINYNPSSIAVQTNEGPLKVYSYPNPFSDHISISINLAERSSATIEIFNLEGKRYYSNSVSLNSGNNTVILNAGDMNSLTNGNYILRIRAKNKNGNISTITNKIVRL